MKPTPRPRLTIIIPTLNEADSIDGCLDPLADLRREGHQVVVVDAGSDDGTAERVRGRVDCFCVAPRGRSSQMNAGLRLAGTGVVLFLHADTRLPPGAAGQVLSALDGDRAVWGRFDVRLSGQARLLRVVERMMNWRSRITGIATGDQAIFVRREALATVGGVPDLPLMEDVELSRRLKRLSRPVCLKGPVVASSRRWEQRGVVRTVMLMWVLRLAWWLGVPAERLARAYYPERRQ